MNGLHLIVIGLIGFLVSVLVFLDWTPKIRPRIEYKPIGRENNQYLLRLIIENTSKVPVKKKVCKFQLLEHSVATQRTMSEFVPFSRSYYEQTPDEMKPKIWKEPEIAFSSTEFLYPGEIITVDRLISIDSEDTYIHMGLQFEGEVPFISRLGLMLWGLGKLKDVKSKPSERWTTTALLVPSKESANK